MRPTSLSRIRLRTLTPRRRRWLLRELIVPIVLIVTAVLLLRAFSPDLTRDQVTLGKALIVVGVALTGVLRWSRR